jgi:hypothetical protein
LEDRDLVFAVRNPVKGESMETWLEERIGNPDLFTGRKAELAYFLKWIGQITRKISQSTAILSRRKTGKTALLQRLFNLTFEKDSRVVPFYFEIRESDQWLGDFATEFFLSFVYQYMAFRTRKPEYVESLQTGGPEHALELAEKEGFRYVADTVRAVMRLKAESADRLWNVVREAPRMTALHYGGFAVQMIDEFQFINRFIFWDREKKRRADNLAGSYLHTCEYKSAPLLVTGSWVGWLMDDLNRMLPGRFLKHPMGTLSEDEAVEMIYKYSLTDRVPVSEKTVWLMAHLTEGNPFYISALFRSKYPGQKDLTTEAGIRRILEYETLNLDGNINATWMEYIDSAFPRINEKYAKDIVLYLSSHRDRRVGHREIREKLGLDMTDPELEKKLKAIFRSDIIEEDGGLYRGVRDNIFDKVFRRSYSDDIHHFVTREAPAEYRQLFEEILEKYDRLRGEYSRYKGAFAEFVIIRRLIYDVRREEKFYKSLMNGLPKDFYFAEYRDVKGCHSPPLHDPEFQIDIFARATEDQYSLIGEVKNRKAKFSVKEAAEFREKAGELMKLENVGKAVLFVFSAGGFFKNTLAYLKKHGMAWSSDKRWLEHPE